MWFDEHSPAPHAQSRHEEEQSKRTSKVQIHHVIAASDSVPSTAASLTTKHESTIDHG